MNKKGFTLIELLATITILSMIMVVAVPSIMSALDKSKRRTYVEDAKKMLTLAEYKFRSNTTIEEPSGTKANVFPLASMDLTDFSDGPEGGSYDLQSSYVVMIKKNNTYNYYVTLVESYGSVNNYKYRGISLKTRDDLLNQDSINSVVDFSTKPSKLVRNNTVKINGTNYTVNYVYS